MYVYIYNQGLSCKRTQAKCSMLQTAKIFAKDINNNNQLSLHGVSWVLPKLQITIQFMQYHFTCKNKIKTYMQLSANYNKY